MENKFSAPELTLFHLFRASAASSLEVEPSRISKAEWQEVYVLAGQQGVLALVWDNIRLLGLENELPRPLKINWSYNVAQIEERYAKQKQLIGELAGFYAGHNIPMMVLKGYGVSLCYPAPNHRPCGDIDIWLFGKQPEADAAMQAAWGIEINNDVLHHTIFTRHGIMVENHYDFLNVHSHASNRVIERILRQEASTPGEGVTVGDATVYLPSPDFNALFLLRHAATHFAAEEIGLRHVADWAFFVRKYHKQVDWTRLERIVREVNMHKFLYALNTIAADYLGVAEAKQLPFRCDTELAEQVLAEILHPKYGKPTRNEGLVRSLRFKLRRWWANRWKHKIVYPENLTAAFLQSFWSHLLKPRSFRH